MFNHSEIEASGRERLNTLQGEARHHELKKKVSGETGHSEQGLSILLRVITFIRPAIVSANGTSVKPEATCQTL